MWQSNFRLPGLSGQWDNNASVPSADQQPTVASGFTNAQDLGSPMDVEDGEVSDTDTPFQPPAGPRASRQSSQRPLSSINGKSPAGELETRHFIGTRLRITASAFASHPVQTKHAFQNPSKQVNHPLKTSGHTPAPSPASSRATRPPLQQQVTMSDNVGGDHLNTQRESSKQFIRKWHHNGYTYDQLVAEDLDPTFLKGIYQELKIPIRSGPPNIASPQTSKPSLTQPPLKPSSFTNARPSTTYGNRANGWLNDAGQSASPRKPPPSETTQTRIPHDAGLPKKPPPSVVQTKDAAPNAPAAPPLNAAKSSTKDQSPAPTRQDYIARLMAAKTKKPDTPNASPGPQASEIIDLSDRPAGSPGLPKKDLPSTVAAQSQFGHHPEPIEMSSPDLAQISGAPKPQEPDPSGSRPQSDAEAMAAAKRRLKTKMAQERMAALLKSKSSKAETPAEPASSPSLPSQKMPSQQRDTSAPIPAAKPPDLTTRRPSQQYNQPPPTARKGSSTSATSSLVPVAGAPTQPSFSGRIPGLFLNSSNQAAAAPSAAPQDAPTADPKSGSHHGQAQAQALARKRPVAADFIDEPWRKRPFGQARGDSSDEPMVIEVSDDESMVDESEPTDRTIKSGGAVDATDAAKRNAVAAPASSRPSLSRTESTKADLAKQENQISELRKQLDLMQQKRQKKGPTGGSEAVAPDLLKATGSQKVSVLPKSSDEPHPTTSSAAANSVKSSPQLTGTEGAQEKGTQEETRHGRTLISHDIERLPQRAINAAGPAVCANSNTATSSQGPSISGMSGDSNARRETTPQPRGELSTGQTNQVDNTTSKPASNPSIDWKTRRRTEIQSGLPALDASRAKNTSKLEALRAQMKELEDSMLKDQQDQERLIAELESLGVDTEGMNHKELQDTKDEIMAQAATDNVDVVQHEKPTPAMPQEASGQSSAASMSISSVEDDSPNEHRSPTMPAQQDVATGPEPPPDAMPFRQVKAMDRIEISDDSSDSDQASESDQSSEGGSEDDEEGTAQAHREDTATDVSMDDDSDAESGEIIIDAPSPAEAREPSSIPMQANAESQRTQPEGVEEKDDQDQSMSGYESETYEPPEPSNIQDHAQSEGPVTFSSSSASSSARKPTRRLDPPHDNRNSQPSITEDEDEEYEPDETLPSFVTSTNSLANSREVSERAPATDVPTGDASQSASPIPQPVRSLK